MESAVVLGSGPWIKPDDLVLPEPPEKHLRPAAPSVKEEPQASLPWQPMSLQELERLHIQKVLEHTGGNKKKAAEILGIERCTLYAKIKSYGD
jgi:DNA-binding NtrC family response regulator